MSVPLVGLMGRKRSGKDYLGAALVERLGFQRLAFADRVRDFVLASDPLIGHGLLRVSDLVEAHGWERAKAHPEVRRALQHYGMAARDTLSADVWLNPLLDDAQRLRATGVPVVVTDVRMPNEVRALRAHGAVLVGVQRDGLQWDAADTHASEALANSDDFHRLCAFTVTNDEAGAGRDGLVARLAAEFGLTIAP